MPAGPGAPIILSAPAEKYKQQLGALVAGMPFGELIARDMLAAKRRKHGTRKIASLFH
jgi:hypothetical protein